MTQQPILNSGLMITGWYNFFRSFFRPENILKICFEVLPQTEDISQVFCISKTLRWSSVGKRPFKGYPFEDVLKTEDLLEHFTRAMMKIISKEDFLKVLSTFLWVLNGQIIQKRFFSHRKTAEVQFYTEDLPIQTDDLLRTFNNQRNFIRRPFSNPLKTEELLKVFNGQNYTHNILYRQKII